jgi:hypothetical protein
LELRKAILVEELERGLHPSDRRDLSAELDEARTCLEGINGERAVEAGQLSWQVVQIFDFIIDLGMMPIQDIPQLLKMV